MTSMIGRVYTRHKRITVHCVITFLLIGLYSIGFTQDRLVLQQISSPVTIDGASNEAAWQNIQPLPMIMYEPAHGGSMTEKTEIRIAYDENFLYASARCFDSDPAGVRLNSLYRDRTYNDDTFTLILDTFNDKENALFFQTNPAGIRIDAAISEDGSSWNGNWNTFWDAAAVKNDQGWFAEIRIPFSSLGFQTIQEEVIIGLIAGRFIRRKNEMQLFPAIPNEWPSHTPSQARETVLRGIKSQKPVYITPYLLGGYGETAVLNNDGTAYRMDGEDTKDIGLDVKYNLTSNLTLDLTVNTDFAQVEADDQRINLTRFSLWFPEKRRFFQERSGTFNFYTGARSFSTLFQSRRIGIHNGEEVPIWGGGRLVGRIGAWDVGILDMQTQSTDDLPTENFGVVRLRRQVFNPYSYTGAMVTSRINEKGDYNIAAGWDASIRLTDKEYLNLVWAQTFDKSIQDEYKPKFIESSNVVAHFRRRSREGLNYRFSLARMGKHYHPGMGFVTRRDFTEFFWSVSYNFFMREDSPMRLLEPLQCFGFVAWRNEDKSVQSAQVEWDTDFHWKTGHYLWADVEMYYEDLNGPLYFPGNTTVPIGSYTFYKCEGGYVMPRGNLLRFSVDFGYGSFYDGTRSEAGVDVTWNASRHLEVVLDYGFTRVDFSERSQDFNSHITRLRVRTGLNKHFSIHGFIQHSSTANFLTSNVRARYNFSEGHDLWLVYNEGINTEREGGELLLPRTNDRTVMCKYVYTWTK